jgi:hypothetical protein
MKELLTALQGAAMEIGYVQKKGRNDFQGYNYVTESDVVSQTRDALLNHDIVMIPSVESVSADEWGNTNIIVLYTIHHTASGQSLTFKMAGAGNDRNSKGVGDKGIYKALTGCNKYALLKALQLATGDDPENEKEEPVRNATQTAPKAAGAKQTPEVKGEGDPWVIEPSKIDKSKFVGEVRDIVKGFIDVSTDVNKLRQFYTINRETWKLLESMDAEAAKQITADFKTRGAELEKGKK